jgi:hypothetical protein
MCGILAFADIDYRTEHAIGMSFLCVACLSSRRDCPSWTRTGQWSFISTTWRNTWSLEVIGRTGLLFGESGTTLGRSDVGCR